MKDHVFIILFLLLTMNQKLQGQIITGIVNKSIPCCSGFPPIYADSLDVNGDNIFEVKIQSSTGIDGYSYHSITIPGVQTNGTVFYGASFPNTWLGVGMPSTIFSSWIGWLPNSGVRYMGFRRINTINDTTYGWIKLNFVGNLTAPIDTMYILEYGYNTIPNSPIWAGEISPLSNNEIGKYGFEIIQNPVVNNLILRNNSMTNFNLLISDMTGRILKRISNLQKYENQIDISNLVKGPYILIIQTKNNRFSKTVMKE